MKSIIEQIIDRKVALAELLEPEALAEMDRWYEPQRLSAGKKLADALSANTSRRIKIYKMQAIMSEFRENPAAKTACTMGCSICCYQQVKIGQTEANGIGDRIGRKPVQLNSRFKMKDFKEYGRNTPCSFLKDEACSIYENRPLLCRNLVNSDRDNLLCSFENWDLQRANDPRWVSIPMPDAQFIVDAFINICRAEVCGDIRDFFPA